MTKRDKLVRRFSSLPKDFTWQELVALLSGFGYRQMSGGRTGGSRVKFLHDNRPPIILHKPHPTTVLKRYQMEQVRDMLKAEGLL